MPRVKHERRDSANPTVYFDVAIKGGPTVVTDLGRVVFELYNDIAPKVSYHCISSVMVYAFVLTRMIRHMT